MILYFSGTGNSEYAARRIGAILNDETLNLLKKYITYKFILKPQTNNDMMRNNPLTSSYTNTDYV